MKVRFKTLRFLILLWKFDRRDHHTLGDMDSKVKSMYLQLYQREWSQAYAHQKHGGVTKNIAHGNLLNIILVGSEITDDISFTLLVTYLGKTKCFKFLKIRRNLISA